MALVRRARGRKPPVGQCQPMLRTLSRPLQSAVASGAAPTGCLKINWRSLAPLRRLVSSIAIAFQQRAVTSAVYLCTRMRTCLRTDTHSTTMNAHACRSRTRLGPCCLRGWCRRAPRIPCLYLLMRSALNTATFTHTCPAMKGFECGITLMMMRTHGKRQGALCTWVKRSSVAQRFLLSFLDL